MVIIEKKTSDLLCYKYNGKTHPSEQIEKLASLIKKIGFRVPILIDSCGVIIAGHGRLAAAKLLGLDVVPCIEHPDLSEAQIRALRLADNKLAELAEDHENNIAHELAELVGDFDICCLGFDIDEQTEAIESKVKEIQVCELQDEFWMSIRGPMLVQPDAIEAIRTHLLGIEGIEVEIGPTGRGE